MQILLAEDHKRLATLTSKALIEDGYVVDVAYDGQSAIDKFEINDYDLVVLDVMLPELSGIEVLQRIRQQASSIPVLLLTALDTTADKVLGLDTGADDYLPKPFSFAELSARVRALLRRAPVAAPVRMTVGSITLDPARKHVTYDDQELHLTAKEYTLLHYLMHHAGTVVSKNDLLEHVWDMNYDGLSNVVETYIRYIRKKIRLVGGNPDCIGTVRNLGYVIK